MNPQDEQLSRLLKAASQAPLPALGTPPWGFETSVLAQSRANIAVSGAAALSFLRRALLCSFAVMALSLVSVFWNAPQPASTETDIAISAIETCLP